MNFLETEIVGVWTHSPLRHSDSRGTFEEQFKISKINKELNRGFDVKQVNQSFSDKGVIRGIHWTDSPQGQAKYVSVTKGSIWDVFVDLRKGSKTFGRWGAEYLSLDNGRSLLLSEGIGHALLALEQGTVVNYLCTSEYDPSSDRTIDPFDESLAIPFERVAGEHGITKLLLSPKDEQGSSFASMKAKI
jgi:dTDP-4-dehydrorhamnose 3,5-epimerase